MAKYFSESDIEEFKECFNLFARRGFITREDELTVIMRSLGYSPTQVELQHYYKDNIKGGKIDFATFLEILHVHSLTERCRDDILAAFKASDAKHDGTCHASEFRRIMETFGEKVSRQEIDRVFREAGIPANGTIRYEEFIKFLMRPI